MSDIDPTSDVAALTVQLLSAYLANNTVASDDLADLIRTTRAALTEDTAAAAPEEPETFTPAVSVRKSLASSEHIISLIDGKRYKTLKRHLASHGLTPESYRTRYNLPASYPMVAPDYAAHRRAVAQKIGLGSRKPTVTNDAPATEPQDEAAQRPVTADADDAKAGKSTSSAKRSTRGGKTSGGTTSPASSAADGDGMSSQAAAPAKKASKRKAASKTTSAQSGENAASVTSANEDSASSNSAPKRRRGKAAAEPSDAQSAATAEASDADTKTSAKSASRKAPAERKKSPRMARPSKSDAADTGASE